MPNPERADVPIAIQATARSWLQAYLLLLDSLRRGLAPQVIRPNVRAIARQIGRKFVEAGFFTPEELERIESGEPDLDASGPPEELVE
jgi:hypothetical protein